MPRRTSKSPVSASNSVEILETDDSFTAVRLQESLILVAKVIHATWDMAPYPDDEPTPAPFLFWGSGTSACASKLIKRYAFCFHVLFDVCFHPHMTFGLNKSHMTFVAKNQMGREHKSHTS